MQTEQELRFSFDWTRGEYAVIAQILRHRGRSIRTVIVRVAAWGTLLVMAAVLGLTALAGEREVLLSMLPWAALLVLTLSLFRWGLPWLQAVQYPKKAQGELQFWATNEELGQASPLGSSNAAWNSLEQVVESEDFLLFYLTDSSAFYLPKRVADTDQLEWLWSLAESTVGFTDRQ
ncbi:MAG TPA: YcxB family protein [Longimicrobiales bacterium]|nr:YcxB family protein [Longimicrobiales bacterium]